MRRGRRRQWHSLLLLLLQEPVHNTAPRHRAADASVPLPASITTHYNMSVEKHAMSHLQPPTLPSSQRSLRSARR